MKHWAAQYIGADYEAVGRCWGLVRTICRDRLGEEMPQVSVGTQESQTANIKRAVAGLGWHKVEGKRPQIDDVVVMEGPEGRHVAWALDVDGVIGVVHACNAETGVEAHRWAELVRLGFHSFEFWRRTQ